MTKKRIPVDGISTADEPRQSLFPHMSAQQSIRTGPRSNSIYAGSNDFQKAGRARALSKRISTTVTTTLGADIQALLNEVTNRNEMRSYYSKGTMQVDEDIQTDPVQADFEEQSQMHSNLRDDFDTLKAISQIQQAVKLESLENETRKQSIKTLKLKEEDFSWKLDVVRDQCQEQLSFALEDVILAHEENNEKLLNKKEAELSKGLEPLQMSLRRAEHGLQKTEQELERLKFGAAQLYVVLKKHNLLSLKESSQADSERLKTAEIIKGYQDRMKSKDDEITVLKHRITRLEERAGAELPPMQPATLGLAFPGLGERRTSRAAPHLGPSGPKIGRPNSRNGSIMPIAAQGTTESISLNIPEPEEDFSKADELQKNYEAKIEELKRVQALELHKATKEKDAAQKYWETRLKSLSRLQKSDTLHKLLKRQSDILAMLAKSKKPPPKKDMELTAFIFGRRLRELPINIAAREEVEETEEYEEIYQDWEDYEDDGEAEQGGIASISLIEKISDNPNPDSTNRRKSVKVRGSTVKPKTSKIPEIGDPLADSSSSTKTGP